MWKKALALTLFVTMLLVRSKVAHSMDITRILGGSGPYPVKHLPMIEKHLCYVYMGPATESLLVDFLKPIEQDARQTGKRKALVFVSRSVNEQAVLDARRKVAVEQERTSVTWRPLDAAVVEEMVHKDKEGARFIIVNTLSPERFPSNLVEHIKKVSTASAQRSPQAQVLDLAQFPARAAGYHLYWEWGKRKRMWVIIYAPGPQTLREVTMRCLEQIAHEGKDKYREPWDRVGVDLWAYVLDPEIASSTLLQETRQYLLTHLATLRTTKAQKGNRWIELWEVSKPSADDLQRISTEGWNCVAFVLHKNIASFLEQRGDLFGALRGDLQASSVTRPAVVSNGQEPLRIVYVGATEGLLRRALKASPDFTEAQPITVEVPDITRVQKVAIVFTRAGRAVVPQEVAAAVFGRLVEELKGTLAYWQVYDQSVLEPIVNLTVINLSGLPGGAETKVRWSPVDAMLVIHFLRYRLKAEWRLGEAKYYQLRLPFEDDEPAPPSPPGGKASSKDWEEYNKALRDWRERHRGWWQQVEIFESELRRTEYPVERQAAFVEIADVEIAVSLVDLRDKFGTVIDPQLQIPSIVHTPEHEAERILQRGHFQYQLLRKPVGEARGDYRGIELELKAGSPRWNELPKLLFSANSPVITRASAMLAGSIREILEERAFLDPRAQPLPPAPPDYLGKVASVSGRHVNVELDGVIFPRAGDWFEVRCRDGSLPKARIEAVTGNMVTAMLQQPPGSIQVGDEVYQTAPPPPPAEPPGPPPVKEIKVQNEVVISLPMQKRPASSRIEALKQQAITLAASKQVQLLQHKHGVEISPQAMLKMAKVTAHSWDARAKQYVVRVRFSGTLSVPVKGE